MRCNISMSDLRESIQLTNFRRCGRDWQPSSLTQTITIGEHWVAFYVNGRGTGTYFDSYELPPLDSRFFVRLLWNSTLHQWNTTPLQGMLSQICGQYCCVFLYFMCNGYNLSQFLNLFSDDCEHNDRLVVELFCKIFLRNKKTCVKPQACCHIQSCTFEKQ